MMTKYLIYTGIFLLLGACSNKAIYYNPDQKRSIYFNWDLNKYVSNVAPDTVFFSFAIYDPSRLAPWRTKLSYISSSRRFCS